MAENKDTRDDQILDRLLSEAGQRSHELSPALLARLHADVDAAVSVSVTPPLRIRPSPVAMQLRVLFAATGLSGAAVVGVWIGFVMPETLSIVTGEFATAEPAGVEAFLPASDFAWATD